LLALLSDPTLLNFVDRAFRGFELALIHVDDFSHADYQELFKLVKESIDQEAEDPQNFIQSRIPDAMFEAYIENASEDSYPDWRIEPGDPKLEALLHMFIRLRRIRIDEGLDQLVYLQTQGSDDSGEIIIDIKKTALDFVQARAKLDQALQQTFSKLK